MQITVVRCRAVSRRSAPEPGKDAAIALPQERRPAGWVLGTMKV